MDFTWAIKEVKEGRKVERKLRDGLLIMFMKDDLIDFEYTGTERTAITNVGLDDIEATDWKLRNKTFNLSENMISESGVKCYIEDDIKEFIKQIKEVYDKKYVRISEKCELVYNKKSMNELNDIIDELAGERFK